MCVCVCEYVCMSLSVRWVPCIILFVCQCMCRTLGTYNDFPVEGPSRLRK